MSALGKIKEQINSIMNIQRYTFIVEPFNINVDLWYGDFHKYKKQIENYYNIPDISEAIKCKKNTQLTLIDHEQCHHFVLLFSDKSGIGYEAHHLTWEICNAVNIKFTPDNHEIQAYLVDHIVREISKKI